LLIRVGRWGTVAAMSDDASRGTPASKKSGFLPPIGSARYHILLGAVAILILGPLGGITAAYMNFSLGFFIGGQVLAGILGSVVTYGYGPEGKHGANYMQTMAASVASMGAMGVLIQAMVWLGVEIPPTWQLILYFLCIGMFGVGVGMLYTPMLVDRMKLTYPSGLAVANILRALTDKRLLKRSVGQLGIGTGVGFTGGFFAEKIHFLGAIGFSASTLGAGMVVGARIGIPAIVVGLIGHLATPSLREAGLLGPNDPFRKLGFLLALGTIMGAALIDIILILRAALQRFSQVSKGTAKDDGDAPPEEQGGKQQISQGRLAAWIGFWGIAVVVAAVAIMKVPIFYAVFAVVLVFLFVMINGISQGISDSNPISSAFVVSVLLMAAFGLKEPAVGILAGAILLVAVSVGCDMQQDRSTGWRLGSNRITQFRYQVIGVTMGAVCAVVITKLFMSAYPVLAVDTFAHPEAKVDQWQSAMTYKFVGALRGITQPDGGKTKILFIGLAIGIVIETIRKMLKASPKWKAYKESGKTGAVVEFIVDTIIVPSPYASSFGGFVDFTTSLWFGGGGILSTVWNEIDERKKNASPKVAGDEDLPEDMSTTSLAGGGLIAGESLAALALGIIGLVTLLK
jgi:uncharacterized oligopeptide transporter (OPT) family protein